MKKQDIIDRLNKLGLDKNEYWVITGSAMVMYGLREETEDIDIGCSKKLADALEKQYGSKIQADGTRKIIIDNDIEIFENWIYDEVNDVRGIPVVSLTGLYQMKHSLGRDKDFKDIALIDAYLRNIKK